MYCFNQYHKYLRKIFSLSTLTFVNVYFVNIPYTFFFFRNPSTEVDDSMSWPAYNLFDEEYIEISSTQWKIKERLKAKQVDFLNVELPNVQNSSSAMFKL